MGNEMKKLAVYVVAPTILFLFVVAFLIIASGTMWLHTPPDPTLPSKLGQQGSPERSSGIRTSRVEMDIVVPVAGAK